MNWLVYPFLVSILLIHRFMPIPRSLTWIPDLLSLLTLLVIILRVVHHEKIVISTKYVFLLTLFLSFAFIGTALNVESGRQIIFGVRTHLKYLPFFLLPAIYDFTPGEVKKQLLLVLGILLLQCPVSILQKVYFLSSGIFTGDVVRGTIGDSGSLSIILVCAAVMVFAFYLRKRIHRRAFYVVMVLLLFPTTINETKVTVVMLPLGLMIPAFLCEGYLSAERKKNILRVVFGLVAFFIVFIPTYNLIIKPYKDAPDFVGLFEKKGYLQRYLYKGVRGKSYEDVRRGDAIMLALKTLSDDPSTMAFGFGVGRVTQSFWGSDEDSLFKKAQQYGAQHIALSQILWETGILGLLLYLALFVFLLNDARMLVKSDDLFGAMALGWCAVVPLIGVCLIYTNMLHTNGINLAFWYFSGLIAAKAKMKALRLQYLGMRFKLPSGWRQNPVNVSGRQRV